MDSILLVEDDLELAEELKERLHDSQTGSSDLSHAESANEDLDEIKAHTQDLLIVDWMLPKMNGPRLIEGWYNPDRLHSGIGYQSSNRYEEEYHSRDHSHAGEPHSPVAA